MAEKTKVNEICLPGDVANSEHLTNICYSHALSALARLFYYQS
jgi:hypothetical protein